MLKKTLSLAFAVVLFVGVVGTSFAATGIATGSATAPVSGMVPVPPPPPPQK